MKKQVIAPFEGCMTMRAGGAAETPGNRQHVGKVIDKPTGKPA